MDINSNDVKIPAIQLFDELGKLFDKELKHALINQKHHKKEQNSENPGKNIE